MPAPITPYKEYKKKKTRPIRPSHLRLLNEAVKKAGGTQAKLAQQMGLDYSTVSCWKSRGLPDAARKWLLEYLR